MKLSKNKRWYSCSVPRDMPIPKGLLLAKDIDLDPATGFFHYAFYPADDMLYAEFREKLKELYKYIQVI